MSSRPGSAVVGHACSLVLARLPGLCRAGGCQGCMPSCASSSSPCSCTTRFRVVKMPSGSAAELVYVWQLAFRNASPAVLPLRVHRAAKAGLCCPSHSGSFLALAQTLSCHHGRLLWLYSSVVSQFRAVNMQHCHQERHVRCDRSRQAWRTYECMRAARTGKAGWRLPRKQHRYLCSIRL